MKYLFPIFQIVLIVLLILLVVVFVVVMFSENPKWIFDLLGVAEKGESKYEALKFLGIGMGGILIALQALMSYKRAKAMEDTAQAQADAAKAQARATEEQAKANQHTEQGQQQERFRNAIEHLGHEKDSVRLGGAYELFHLAEDTEELRQTVLDILCAHIRWTTGESKYRETHKSKPSEEVQSLLTLIFLQEHEVFKGFHINLQGSWLNGADLRKARLENAVLVEVNLQEANLDEARLKNARLDKAELKNARLYKAQMQGAVLTEAQMQGAILAWAQMQRAELIRTQMQGVMIAWAQMQGVELYRAQMQGAILEKTQMQGAVLIRTQMQGAVLTETQMQGAVLAETQMQGTILEKTQMQGVTMDRDFFSSFEERIKKQIGKKSNLTRVIFKGGLSEEKLYSIVADTPKRGKLDSIVADFFDKDDADLPSDGERLREALMPHVGKPESNIPPKDCDTGIYTEEDAEKWIAEYEKAMSKIPADDN